MNIKVIREFYGLSQGQLSKKYNIPLMTIKHWEAKDFAPTEYTLKFLRRFIEANETKECIVPEQTIRELRMLLGITRIDISKRYNIPIRTIEDWESGRRTPPKYLEDAIKYCIKEDYK